MALMTIWKLNIPCWEVSRLKLRLRLKIAGFITVVLLTGCASLSRQQCQSGDWQAVGFADALAGHWPAERLDEHQQACGEFGIALDTEVYQEGHAAGVPVFCTAENGFKAGRRGYLYDGLCATTDESGFLQGYADGREVYWIDRQLMTARHFYYAADLKYRPGVFSETFYLRKIERLQERRQHLLDASPYYQSD